MSKRLPLVTPAGTHVVYDVERITELPNGDFRIEAPDGSAAIVPVSEWGPAAGRIKAAANGRGSSFRLDLGSQPQSGTPIQAKAGIPKLSPDFAKRVADREVDLLEVIDKGIPELQFLPGAEGIFLKGRRHLIAAPAKSGKSMSTQVHVLHMVQAGAKVIVLDRENARDIYARRMDAILKVWGGSKALRKCIRSSYRYVEFPNLTAEDGPDLVLWAQAADADLVVFDSQRMFLTDQDLNEDDADDYSKFMGASVDPLFEAGIATLILDNTGHTNESRSRGSSAKRDLNEILFTLKTTEPFSEEKKGRVQLTLAPGDSRLGHHGEWTMAIGGGEFEAWHQQPSYSAGRADAKKAAKAIDEGQKLILKSVKKKPCTRNQALKDCVGQGIGKKRLEQAIGDLLATGDLVRDDEGVLHASR